MLWVLKITVLIRRFFWAPKTCGKNYGKENIDNFTLIFFVCLSKPVILGVTSIVHFVFVLKCYDRTWGCFQVSLPVRWTHSTKLDRWWLEKTGREEPDQGVSASWKGNVIGSGAQWLSGRVLDSRPKGRGFEPHQRPCLVSLSKNINPSLVLVQPRKTRPFITKRFLMGRKESNQTM